MDAISKQFKNPARQGYYIIQPIPANPFTEISTSSIVLLRKEVFIVIDLHRLCLTKAFLL